MKQNSKLKPYDTVIFDLDGTLLDTLEDLTDCVNHILVKFDYPERTKAEVRSFVGNGIAMLMKRALPENVDEERLKEVVESFRIYYTAHCSVKTKPYPGIMELLGHLKGKGYKLAVVSNKNDDAVKKLEQVHFPGMFLIAMGKKDGVRKKPAPDAVLEVMRQLQTEKATALYVGDSEVDKQTADNSGVDCVLVDWGFKEHDYLLQQNPKKVVSSTEELLELLEQNG